MTNEWNNLSTFVEEKRFSGHAYVDSFGVKFVAYCAITRSQRTLKEVNFFGPRSEYIVSGR